MLLTEVNKISSLLLGPAHNVSPRSPGPTHGIQPRGCMGAGISPGPATASARGGQASKTTVRARCRSAHVCSACKPKPRFLQCQHTRRDGMRRAHLCPTRSWITGDNHEPPDVGAHLGLLFTIPLSVAHRGLQQVSNDLFIINSSKKHWHSN